MLTGTSSVSAELPLGPRLGEPAGRAELSRRLSVIFPDGRGLPPGQGSASGGKAVYDKHCQSCHGPGGQGASADQLAGARMQLTGEWPEKTIGTYWPYATTLFDFIRRAMPMQAPGSLSDDEVYAVTAYLLFLNGIIAEDEVMDAASLGKVRMPNRDGFIDLYRARENQPR